MIISFIYTQCASPGPFKSQAGYKIKSAQQVSADGSTQPVDGVEAERLLYQAVGALPNYTAPEIGPFTTEQQFMSLPRKWAYLPVRELDDSSDRLAKKFVLARLFTSGESSGRPSNIFHQGIVCDDITTSCVTLQALATELAHMPHATPADFAAWQDWLNPRGDSALELSELEEDNPPIPGMTRVEWNLAVERLFDYDEILTTANLRNVENELIQIFPGAALIGAERDSEFLLWVSAITHLIPAEGAWKTPFVSEGKIPKQRAEKEEFGFRGVKPAAALNGKIINEIGWARLVKLVVESGLLLAVEDRIHSLALGNVSMLDPRYALADLPLAVATMDLAEFADDQVADVLSAFHDFWAAVEFKKLVQMNPVLRSKLSGYFSAPNSVLAHSPKYRDEWLRIVD